MAFPAATGAAALLLGVGAVTLPGALVLAFLAVALGLTLVTPPELLLLACVAVTVAVNAGYVRVLGPLRFALLALLLLVLLERSRGSRLSGSNALKGGVVVASVILIVDSAARFRLDEGVLRAVAMVILLSIALILPRARTVETLALAWSRLFGALVAFVVVGTLLRPAVTPDSFTLAEALRGPFGNPNALGLLAGACFVWLLAIEGKQLTWLLLPVLGVLLIASQSRGALLGTIAAVAIFSFNKRRYLSMTLAAIVGLLLVSPGRVIAGLEGDERFVVWRTALSASWKSPFSGVGFGKTEATLQSGALMLPPEFQGLHLHNSYVEVLYELGLVPGLIFLAAIGVVLGASLRRAPTSGPLQFLRPLIAFGIVSAFAESWMFSSGSIFALVFWVAVGTVWARSGREHSSERRAAVQPAAAGP